MKSESAIMRQQIVNMKVVSSLQIFLLCCSKFFFCFFYSQKYNIQVWILILKSRSNNSSSRRRTYKTQPSWAVKTNKINTEWFRKRIRFPLLLVLFPTSFFLSSHLVFVLIDLFQQQKIFHSFSQPWLKENFNTTIETVRSLPCYTSKFILRIYGSEFIHLKVVSLTHSTSWYLLLYHTSKFIWDCS